MNDSKTEIRILSDGIDFQGKAKGYNVERTESVPIVLWGKTEPAAVLSLHSTSVPKLTITETHQFNKRSLDGKKKSIREKLADAVDDYPVTYKLTIKNPNDQQELRTINPVEFAYVLTADINGDGTEELLIPRAHGEIDVYDTKKRLFRSPPWDSFLPPQEYELLSIKTHIANFDNRDAAFFVYNRIVAAGGLSRLSDAERKRARQEKVSAIFLVDQKGIRQIVPYGVNWILKDVIAVGALNYPESKEIDEIVVLHELEDNTSGHAYLTRLKPDGQVIDPPRKFYQPFNAGGFAKFIFVPQSRQIVIEAEKAFYFITPEKPANWARRVDMQKPFSYAGMLRGDKGTVFLARLDKNIYAVDEESRYYTRDGYGRLQRSPEKKPFYTIQLESGLHRLADVVVSKQSVDKPEYLIVQEREPQMKGEDLTWEKNYWPAAQKFMKEDWIQELRRKSQRYLRTAREVAEEEYLAKYGKKRALPTLNDVQEHFPEYYKQFMEKAEDKFRSSVIGALTQPLRGTKSIQRYFDSKTNFEDHNDYEGFRKWCEPLFIPDELVFTLVMDFKPQMKARVPNLNQDYTQLGNLLLRMPLTSFRQNTNLLNIASIGHFKGALDTYITKWLYIHHEGGLR